MNFFYFIFLGGGGPFSSVWFPFAGVSCRGGAFISVLGCLLSPPSLPTCLSRLRRRGRGGGWVGGWGVVVYVVIYAVRPPLSAFPLGSKVFKGIQKKKRAMCGAEEAQTHIQFDFEYPPQLPSDWSA